MSRRGRFMKLLTIPHIFKGVIMNIKVFLAEGFEDAEAVIVIDILRRAKYNVQTVSITGNFEVVSARGITVKTDALFKNAGCVEADCLFFPGGMGGVNNLKANKQILDLVRDFDSRDKYIAAICAAPLILEDARILAGKKVTSYPGLENELSAGVYLEEKVVVDGKLITSRGIGTAIDMGLKLIELFSGKETSDTIARSIVYG